MYALAADCSIGSAGSAILMTHSRAAQGEPALIYLKVTGVLFEIFLKVLFTAFPHHLLLFSFIIPPQEIIVGHIELLDIIFPSIFANSLPLSLTHSLGLFQLFPLTGDSDMVSHFMGVQIDLPLTPAERDALLTHCNSTAAAPAQSSSHEHMHDQGAGYHQGQSQGGQGGQVVLCLSCL